MSEIKPCFNPNCCAEDSEVSVEYKYYPTICYWVRCSDCGMAGPVEGYESAAITAWNQVAETKEALKETKKVFKNIAALCTPTTPEIMSQSDCMREAFSKAKRGYELAERDLKEEA